MAAPTIEIVITYRPVVGMHLDGQVVVHDDITGKFVFQGTNRLSTNLVYVEEPTISKTGRMYKALCQTRSGQNYMAYWKAEDHTTSGSELAGMILGQALGINR